MALLDCGSDGLDDAGDQRSLATGGWLGADHGDWAGPEAQRAAQLPHPGRSDECQGGCVKSLCLLLRCHGARLGIDKCAPHYRTALHFAGAACC